MKHYRVVALLLIAALMIGCSPMRGTKISGNRMVPKVFEFTIVPNINYGNSLLDFNSVYLMSLAGSSSNAYHKYFRFWANGRVLTKSTKNQLVECEDAEDFSDAIIGYYKVDKENLVMEFFIPDSTILNWDYIRIYAEICKNGDILVNSSEMRGEVSKFLFVYKKRAVCGLIRQPDW